MRTQVRRSLHHYSVSEIIYLQVGYDICLIKGENSLSTLTSCKAGRMEWRNIKNQKAAITSLEPHDLGIVISLL